MLFSSIIRKQPPMPLRAYGFFGRRQKTTVPHRCSTGSEGKTAEISSAIEIFTHAPMPVCIIDARGRICGSNPAFAKKFPALVKTKGKNRDWFAAFEPDPLADESVRQDLPHCLHALQRSKTSSAELVVRFVGSRAVYCIVFFLHADDKSQTIAVFHNITAEYHLREKLSGVAAREAIGQLVGGIAHDFNNMITATKGSIAALLDIIPPRAPGYTDLQMIEQSCAHASQFTAQIMGLSRDIKSAHEPLDFSPVLESMEPLLLRVFQHKIPVEIYHDAEHSHILGNEVQIEQMILNLALNARDAMESQKRKKHNFSLKTRNKTVTQTQTVPHGVLYAGDYLTVELADTGGGIPEDVISHIFEPFFTTKDVGQGTGLGLSMVNSIMQKMGGAVSVRNNRRGAMFSLDFQLADMRHNNETLTGIATVIAQKNKVLLVDDEPSVRFFTAKILRKYGYQVTEAENGANALKIARAEMPDLLVTDIKMPHMTGVELIKKIKTLNPDLPAIGISGFVRDQDFENIAHLPHISFIAKPFNTQQLKEKVEHLLCAAYCDELETAAKSR